MSEPNTLTVRNISNILVEVVNWYQLGIELDMKPYKLEEIRHNRMGDVQLSKLSMFDIWLRSDLEASWEKISKALRAMGQDVLAEKVLDEYGTGKRGVKAPRVAADYSRPGARQQSQKGPSVVMEDTSGRRELMELIQSKEEDKVDRLFQGLTNWDYDINFGDKDMNQTLLHIATQAGDVQIVKAVIAYGGNVNCKNRFGQTPLDLARMIGNDEIAGLLKSVGSESGLPGQQREQESPMSDVPTKKDGFNILSLDNSGETAIIQLEVLHQIEQHTGKKITELFDWIVASGTGALLIMAMVYANKTMADVRRLYFKLKEGVFDEKRDKRSTNLDDFVRGIFGTTARMVDEQKPKLLIGAVNKRTTRLELHFFNNCLGDEDSQVSVWKVARYTCGSPLSIAECDGYTDAGAVCSNLSSFAMTRIQDFCKQNGLSSRGGCLVSVGAGYFAAEELGEVDVRDELCFRTRWLNPAESKERMKNVVTFYSSAAVTLSEEITKSCERNCAVQETLFYHFNPLFTEIYYPQFEELSLKSIMEIIVQTIIQVVGRKFDELCLVSVMNRDFELSPDEASRAALQFVQ